MFSCSLCLGNPSYMCTGEEGSVVFDCSGLTRVLTVAASGTLTMKGVNFQNSGSSSVPKGGAVLVEAGGSLSLQECRFTRCTAVQGGGLFFQGSGFLALQTVIFEANHAVDKGAPPLPTLDIEMHPWYPKRLPVCLCTYLPILLPSCRTLSYLPILLPSGGCVLHATVVLFLCCIRGWSCSCCRCIHSI